MEKTTDVYDELFEKAGSKAKTSLLHIKKACDLIETTRGIMNIKRVGDLATEQYGGPKQQSIRNSNSLKRYILCRIDEYQNKSSGNFKKYSVTKPESKYPVSDLDARTKLFIDNLVARGEMIEARYNDLKKWQENFTKEHPVDLSEAISSGPSQLGDLSVKYDMETQILPEEVIVAIRTLLDLPNHLFDIIVEEKGEKRALILKKPSGDHVLLAPNSYKTLTDMINQKNFNIQS
ncbi:MAG: hypothetical protein JKY50_07930 [Oleispira sp.]|nr:hypothetical protein [Oleispira sp.]MBL4880203.1 hypothetical protein [Oleispira sp.]